jgi:hypothetical protein
LVFAAWLVHTFGHRLLRTDGGVLDIAGGSGTLSYELSVRYGVRSTVWDLRNIELSSMLRRKIRKLTRNRERSAPLESEHGLAICDDGDNNVDKEKDKDKTVVDHSELMLFVRSYECLSVTDDGAIADDVTKCLSGDQSLPFGHYPAPFCLRVADFDGDQTPASAASAGMHQQSGDLSKRPKADSSASSKSLELAAVVKDDVLASISFDTVLSASSVLVGMHPDQVTEAIVDVAIRYQKPFAAVPCCVFTNLFPERVMRIPTCGNEVGQDNDASRSSSGFGAEDCDLKYKSVQTYEEFIEYLVAKHGSIRTFELPFLGRNKVVYSLGPY